MTLSQMESRFFELKGKLAVGQITEDEFKREMETLRFQDRHGNWWMIGAQSGRWYYYDGSRWLLGQPNDSTVGSQVTPSALPEQGQSAPATVSRPSNGQNAPPQTQALPTSAKAPYYVPPPQTLTPTNQPTPNPASPFTPQAVPTAKPLVAPDSNPKPVAGNATRTLDASNPSHTLAERFREDMAHIHGPTVHVPQMHVPSVHVPPMHMPQVHTPAPIRRFSPNVILIGAIIGGLALVFVMWAAVDFFVPGKPISSFFGKSIGIGVSSAATTPTARLTAQFIGANVDDLLGVADDLISKSHFDAGLSQYQTAARLAPGNPDVFSHWSRALALAGRIQEATNTAQRATRLDPNSSDAYAQLARALAWSGQVDAAVNAGEKAISLNPKSATAHAFLAEAFLRGGQQSDAEKEASAAIDAQNTDADGHRAMGWVALVAGRKDEALTEWQQVVTLAPDISFYHFEFAQVYGSYLNDPANAVPEFQKAIQLYPPYVPSYIALGSALLAQNQPGPAILQYQKALTYDPNSIEAYVGLGLAFQKQGRCEQAIPYFQKSVQLNSRSTDALKGLASCGALAKGQTIPPDPGPTVVGLAPIPTAIVQATVAPLGAITPLPRPTAPGTPAPSTASAGTKSGGKIAFSVFDGQFHLYTANTDGSARKLLAELASDPIFSPDGSQLLFTSWTQNARGIHRIEANGTGDHQVSLRVEDLLPSWSLDGTRYVYATRAGLGADITKRAYSIRISDPTAKAGQDPPPFVERAQYPVWGPGDKIVFRDCGFPTDSCGLAVINSDGSGKTSLVANMNSIAPAWSNDGKLIAYTSDYGGNWDIYIVASSGGSPARLTTDPAEDGLPTFSPDGKQIAFLSHRDGTWAVWAMGIDGSNQHKLFDLGGDPAGAVPGNSPAQPGQAWYEQKLSWH